MPFDHKTPEPDHNIGPGWLSGWLGWLQLVALIVFVFFVAIVVANDH